MPSREYFYRDQNGKIKKFTYCCLCGAGPFKRSQKDYEYFTTGSRSELVYCLRCAKGLNLTMEGMWDKSSMVAKETVKIIDPKNIKRKEPKKESPDIEYIPNKNDTQKEDIKKEIIRYDEMYEIEEKNDKPILKKQQEDPDRTGVFYIYIGQYYDDTFRVDITENIEEEIEKINSGTNPNIKKLPIELLYYHIVTSWKQALFDKDQILHMNASQKEELIEKFIKNIFEK